MIRVTFEFDSIEKAVATLGSLMQKGAPVPNAANPAVPAATEKKSTRKPRADAGQPRGPYKNAGALADADPKGHGSTPTPDAPAPETAAPTAPAEADNAQPSGVTPSVAAAPSPLDAAKPPSEAEAQNALTALFNAKGLAKAQETLGKFGVQALRHLPADKRGEFIAAANEAAK